MASIANLTSQCLGQAESQISYVSMFEGTKCIKYLNRMPREIKKKIYLYLLTYKRYVDEVKILLFCKLT